MRKGIILGAACNVIPVKDMEVSSDEGKYGKFFVVEDRNGNVFDV